MANLNALPKEILHKIISYMGSNLPNLVECSRVCKSLSEVANAALYHHIDLKRDEKYDEEADEKTDRRQARLIRSIAENPQLGSLVRVFKNYNNQPAGKCGDGTTDDALDSELLIRAAKIMTQLSKALLTPNQVAAYIIANLPSYPQLVDLNVYGFRPEEHIWRKSPVALRKLTWTASTGGWGASWVDPWNSIGLLVNVVEATCPNLESLDISFSDRTRRQEVPEIPTVAPERVQQYVQARSNDTSVLLNLQHIGLRYGINEEADKHDKMLEGLVERYSHSLTSVSIPIGHGPWTRRRLEHILKMCQHLPGLKSLSLANSNHTNGLPGNLSSQEFLHELTTVLASPRFEIERLSIISIDCSFSKEIGTLFQSMKSLKYLCIGDGDMENGPFGNDGRPMFGDYKPEVLDFVRALPSSLQELIIELNGPDLSCDEDEDFDPMCDMGPVIFGTLRRLRSCDIHAWISNADGGLGWIPEKGVFYRRLSHVGNKHQPVLDPWEKGLWTSRMDCIYQEDGAEVQCKIDLLAGLKDAVNPFAGPDAEEAWLGGWTYKVALTWTGMRASEDGPDYSWPFWTNKLNSYESFRDRHA